MMPPLVPCAATATSFLYAEQNWVLCFCRKTLAFERLFGRHGGRVTLIVPSRTTELVVSCDSNTAIVWKPASGEEKNRLSFQERITAAAWMDNGNVVLGTSLGKIVLFNPTTASSDYKLTLDQEITAISTAVLQGGWFFAVGYRNGSLLLYKVSDSLEVIHDMSHNSAPIMGLTWHSSHPLLAIHDADGNLGTWRLDGNAPPTKRRIVERRKEQSVHCWMGWSKGGRLLHYRDGEACAWDVRGPVLKREPLSVPDGVVGLSAYGPGAKLFVLGEDKTVQLLDLTRGRLVISRQHPHIFPMAKSLPVGNTRSESHSPQRDSIVSVASDAPSRASTEITVMFSTSGESEWDSRSEYEGSFVTNLKSSVAPSVCSNTPSCSDIDDQSSTNAGSPTALHARSFKDQGDPSHGSQFGLPLDHFPNDMNVVDLFPRTRNRLFSTRLSQLPPPAHGNSDHENQILAVLFDWVSTTEDLVRSEMSHTRPTETRHGLLAGWLACLDTSGGIAWGEVNAKQQLAYTCLKVGDIYIAVSLLLSGRLHRQAINLYETNGRYLEAVIASLLFLPSWEHQSRILLQWALAEEHNALEFSLRCHSLVKSLTTLPPPINAGPTLYSSPQRDLVKIANLRLATSFGVAPSGGSEEQSLKARLVYPNAHRSNASHTKSPLSALPKTAIDDRETTLYERGQKLSRIVFKWTRKGSRDSKDDASTLVPVTAYKEDKSPFANVI